MTEVAASFQAADTDQDSMLIHAEFPDFMAKVRQNSEARGVPFAGNDDLSDEMKRKMYDYFLAKSEGAAGITMAGFMAGMQEIRQAMTCN